MLIREPYSDVRRTSCRSPRSPARPDGHADVDGDDVGISSPDGGVHGFVARVVGVGGAEDHVLWPQLQVLHHRVHGGGRVGDEHEVVWVGAHILGHGESRLLVELGQQHSEPAVRVGLHQPAVKTSSLS